MNVYVAFDGDSIGQMVGRARLADDVEAVRQTSQRIDLGNEIWRSWAVTNGGSVVEMGGDEGAVEVPADALEGLPAIRDQYQGKVQASVSVGVGTKLSEASKALIAAKLQGKDRIVFYSDDVDAIIAEAEKQQPTEAAKIADEYLGKAAPALRGTAFRHPQTGQVVETGPIHDETQVPESGQGWTEGFVTHEGQFLDRRQAADYVKMSKLRPSGRERNWLDSGDKEAGLNKAAAFAPGPNYDPHHGATFSEPPEFPEPPRAFELKDILASHKSLLTAHRDNVAGRRSHTPGPLSVHALEDGRHLLVDGHHRLAEHLATGNLGPVYAAVAGRGYSDYHATPDPMDEADYPSFSRNFRLNKAAPAMNPGAFAGASRPSPPTTDKPVATQGEHSEAQSLYDMLGDENAPAPAEATHAGADFERQLHDEAWKGEEEDMQSQQQRGSNLTQIKAQVAQALSVLKAQMPVLEQLKGVSPQAYQAMMGLTTAVVAMARELVPAQSLQKAEAKPDAAARHVDNIRNVLSEDLLKPEYKGSGHCMAGHCYVAAEAAYHLLGGKEGGWTAHHIQHEGGPHWFLRHDGGRILDPTSDQFQTPVPYDKGVAGGFLTYPMPSARTKAVLERMLGEGTAKPKDVAAIAGDRGAVKKEELKTEVAPSSTPPTGPELEKAVSKAAEAGIDVGDHKWVTTCDKHGTMVGSKTKRQADAAAKDTTSFCDDCREPIEKAGLPMPKVSAHHNVVLPVGSQVDQKIKVQHQDGATSWKQVGAGQIRSMDPAGHPTSSRSPNSK